MSDNRSRRISTLGSRITSLVSVTLVLVLAGLAAIMAIVGTNISDEVRRNLGFVIKMERGCDDTATNRLKQSLLASPGVRQLTFVSADDILAQESEYLGDDISSMLDQNPYSAEFDVKVKPTYAHPDSIASLVEKYRLYESVAGIVTESAVIEGVDATLKRIGSVLAIAAVLLLAICVALINNTVSLSIYARRFVIHTMKLVGATGRFIRKPFLKAAAANGLIAGAVASLAMAGAKVYADGLDPMFGDVLPWIAVSLLCVALTAAGIAICMLTAAFATNRYLKASYDEMFLK